ncbi:MAG: tetraacyldisaccharide 4'-kinase [Candidatus Omnitrophota bacterium]
MKNYIYKIITQGPKDPMGFAIKIILYLFSFLYLAAVKLRYIMYKAKLFKSERLKAPVVSIGNITWGGTGKTPLVEAICGYFQSKGKRCVLLTRGYGMDEDKALAQNLPDALVLIGEDRVKNARSEETKGPVDIFLLDDGFQHMKIERDIDIVTINATDPFGNGCLIPAGILREPPAHLNRAEIVVITKSGLIGRAQLDCLKNKIIKLNPNAEIFESAHKLLYFQTAAGEEKDTIYIKGKNVCIVSALGDNSSFAKSVESLCDSIKLHFFYMDHHQYSSKDIDIIIKECRGRGINTIVTTQKDWVKLKDILKSVKSADGVEFLILKIKVSVSYEKNFYTRLSSIVSG